MILKSLVCVLLIIVIANGGNSADENKPAIDKELAHTVMAIECEGHCATEDKPATETELLMITTMFRHGDRTPEPIEMQIIPGVNISETFYPVGLGQLTNKGKLRMFKNGMMFREKYNEFFGDIVEDGDVLAYTTVVPRTGTSVLAFMAGLFPPKGEQKWKEECNNGVCDVADLWNPVPYVYREDIQTELLMHMSNCTEFTKERTRVESLPEVQDYIAEHESLFKEISTQSGVTVTTPAQVFVLFNVYNALNAAGVKMISWAEHVLDKVRGVMDKAFEFTYYNDKLKILSAGAIANRIINDMVLKSKGELQPKNRKLIVYSGHDMCVSALYASLGGEKGFVYMNGDPYPVNFPNFGATIILELHQIIETEQFVVKFFYHNFAKSDPVPIKLVECEVLCPLEKYLDLTRSYRITIAEQIKLCEEAEP